MKQTLADWRGEHGAQVVGVHMISGVARIFDQHGHLVGPEGPPSLGGSGGMLSQESEVHSEAISSTPMEKLYSRNLTCSIVLNVNTKNFLLFAAMLTSHAHARSIFDLVFSCLHD